MLLQLRLHCRLLLPQRLKRLLLLRRRLRRCQLLLRLLLRIRPLRLRIFGLKALLGALVLPVLLL
jgi:hypothetical protein